MRLRAKKGIKKRGVKRGEGKRHVPLQPRRKKKTGKNHQSGKKSKERVPDRGQEAARRPATKKKFTAANI